MAEKVVAEAPLLRDSGEKRPYTKINWSQYVTKDAEGNPEVWKLTRESDFPDVDKSRKIVEMAQRFATSNKLILQYASDQDNVWVKFTERPAIEGTEPGEGEGGEGGEVEPPEGTDPFQPEPAPAAA